MTPQQDVKILKLSQSGNRIQGAVEVNDLTLIIGNPHGLQLKRIGQQSSTQQYETLPGNFDLQIETSLTQLKRAFETEDWGTVTSQLWEIEGGLIFSGRWDDWVEVLFWGFKAAQATQNKELTAKILHQVGSRALCLGDTEQAKKYLGRSLNRRKKLPNEQAISITQRNFNLLSNSSASVANKKKRTTSRSSSMKAVTMISMILLVIFSLVCIGGSLLYILLSASSVPSTAIAVDPSPSPTSIPTQTLTFTPSSTPPLHIPKAVIRPNVINFGEVGVGEFSATEEIFVFNEGAGLLEIGNVSLSGTSFNVQTDTCSSTSIAPGNNCAITVEFNPQFDGSHEATIALETNSSPPPSNIFLEGFGLSSQLGVSQTSLNFGVININSASSPQSFEIFNDGAGVLYIEEISGLSEFEVVADTCTNAALQLGSSCTITLIFSPSSVGEKVESLFVWSNSSSVEFTLYGQGAANLVGLKEKMFLFTGGGPGNGCKLLSVSETTQPFIETRNRSGYLEDGFDSLCFYGFPSGDEITIELYLDNELIAVDTSATYDNGEVTFAGENYVKYPAFFPTSGWKVVAFTQNMHTELEFDLVHHNDPEVVVIQKNGVNPFRFANFDVLDIPFVPGDMVQAVGSNFTPFEQIQIGVYGPYYDLLAEADLINQLVVTTDSQGSFNVEIPIDQSLDKGNYSIIAVLNFTSERGAFQRHYINDPASSTVFAGPYDTFIVE